MKSIGNSVPKSDYAYNSRNQLTSETQTLAGRPASSVSFRGCLPAAIAKTS